MKVGEKILSFQLEWIKNADSKVSPLFAIDIAMTGIIVALIKALPAWTIPTAIFSSLTLIPIVLSIIFLALSMFPRLRGPKGSIIFFGGITQRSVESYIEEVKNVSTEKYETDLLMQAYRNAEIAETKFRFITYSFIATFISVPFWGVSIYLLYV